jgi:hypothetical protein
LNDWLVVLWCFEFMRRNIFRHQEEGIGRPRV